MFADPQSSVLLSSDGRLLGAQISSQGQWHFAPAESVPPKFAKCLILYEDKRFRFHPGVDFIAAGRALVQNVRRGEVVSGASTITMQTIRLSRPSSPRSMAEKLYEAILATRLELRCSKDKILLMYASNAPFGGNVRGIEAASWRYFGCNAADLSWAESAMLAVLPNSPSLIHPGRNRDALKRKRDALLDKLCARHVIDQEECALAKDEPLPEKPLPMPDMAFHLLQRCRQENGGGTFRTTIDYALQQRVSAVAQSSYGIYHSNLVDNMGIIVLDVHSGEIISYYGNTRGCHPVPPCADVDMIPAARSSGSTLKPMLYAAMLQDGMLYPGTLVKDTPYNNSDFSPHNFNRTFEGAVPAHEVIERSLNVPSVRMLERYGAEEFLDLLHGMGMSTINRDADHYGLSLILGGAEISLETLARAYYYMAAKLEDDDILRTPSYLQSSRAARIRASEIPLGNAAIWLTFDALSHANRPEEEASWMDFASGGKVAWKTGTSWGDRDAWSVGVTPDHVVAVWVGNSSGEGRAGLTGVSYAAPVMFEIFSFLGTGRWFDMPAGEMKQVEVCSRSGLPAGSVCPDRETVWVPASDSIPPVCSYHRLVHLDKERRYQVNSGCCPIEEMVTDSCFVLPPAMEWYYRQSHSDYKTLPPKHPQFEASSSQFNPLEIIYPHQGMTVVVTRDLDGREGGVVFKAAHSDPDAVLYWHLDDEYTGQTQGTHEKMFKPAPGEHVLTVVDGEGFRRAINFSSR